MTTTSSTRPVPILSDAAVQRQVEEEFAWDPAVPTAAIGVTVTDRSVTLSGYVEKLAERLAAVKAAKRVKGVRAIADDIVVRPAGGSPRSDHDVARTVEEALEWNTQIPDTVWATVRDSIVTLDGTADWDYQRRAAQRVVQHLVGVKHVTNRITLKQTASPTDVHGRITAALHRQAELDSHSIEVTSNGTEVWLTGSVSNWAEREQAEAAAWAAPGVTMVHDNLRIS
jgi:osmotically-inducible protein OsmY